MGIPSKLCAGMHILYHHRLPHLYIYIKLSPAQKKLSKKHGETKLRYMFEEAGELIVQEGVTILAVLLGKSIKYGIIGKLEKVHKVSWR